VALAYGPLVYNIEAVDQDLGKMLGPSAPLASEWRADLLGGVRVMTGRFTDGSPLLAIPNYARYNRGPLPSPPLPPPAPPTPPAPPPAPAAGAAPAPRPAPPPAAAIVWIKEGDG
jgi:hypothetical protein